MSPEGLGYLWHVKIRSETNINSGKQNTYQCMHTCTYVGLRYEENGEFQEALKSLQKTHHH